MDFSQFTELSQKQNLSQGQILSLTILSMDTLDLRDFLVNEFDTNPMLDVSFSADVFHRSLDQRNERGSIERFPDNSFDLKAYVLNQIPAGSGLPEPIVMYLIDSLDERGYCVIDLEEGAEQLGVSLRQMTAVLDHLKQHSEPMGLFSESMAECLKIQLKRCGYLTIELSQLIDHHSASMAAGKFGVIAQSLGVSVGQAHLMVEQIREMNPYPLNGLMQASSQSVIPDIIISYEQSEWKIDINDRWINRIEVNVQYQSLLKKSDDANLNQFLADKAQRVYAIGNGIKKRRQTLSRIVEWLIARNQSYFLGLKPLTAATLTEMAHDLDLSVSTVSRAIAKKFIQLPNQTCELRSLFQKTEYASDENSISSTNVKELLSALIAQEDSHSPLSDNELSVLMKQRKINISRRTIAKYRRQLNIPNTMLRKRMK